MDNDFGFNLKPKLYSLLFGLTERNDSHTFDSNIKSYSNLLDLNHYPFVTIDPESARFREDAIYIEELDEDAEGMVSDNDAGEESKDVFHTPVRNSKRSKRIENKTYFVAMAFTRLPIQTQWPLAPGTLKKGLVSPKSLFDNDKSIGFHIKIPKRSYVIGCLVRNVRRDANEVPVSSANSEISPNFQYRKTEKFSVIDLRRKTQQCPGCSSLDIKRNKYNLQHRIGRCVLVDAFVTPTASISYEESLYSIRTISAFDPKRSPYVTSKRNHVIKLLEQYGNETMNRTVQEYMEIAKRVVADVVENSSLLDDLTETVTSSDFRQQEAEKIYKAIIKDVKNIKNPITQLILGRICGWDQQQFENSVQDKIVNRRKVKTLTFLPIIPDMTDSEYDLSGLTSRDDTALTSNSFLFGEESLSSNTRSSLFDGTSISSNSSRNVSPLSTLGSGSQFGDED